jgi:His-Xaa-Ser repeat protein HxsA
MRKRTFLIPSLLAAGFGAHDPAQAGLTHATTTGNDDPDRGNLLRQFSQDHLVTLAQHRSHSSHSSHSSHTSSTGGGGHYSHTSHTSHRSSTGGYDPYYPPAPVYPAPAPPPPPPPSYPPPSRVRATPPPGEPLPSTGSAAQRASPPGSEALPALSGRTQRFAAIVRRVQIALMAQGLFQGPITGSVGPVTRAALRRFQQARGLAVTGTITPQTLDALMIASE